MSIKGTTGPIDVMRLYYKPGAVLHFWVRSGCAPVLGSFWPKKFWDWDILLLVNFCDWGILSLGISGIGVYCYTKNSGNGR